MAWWQRKVVALFHDPPDKVLDIATHKDRAKVLMQLALQGLPDVPETGIPPAEWEDNAKKADMIASAADRLNFPEYAQAPFDLVVHPLSGQQMPVKISVNLQQASGAQSEVVRKLSNLTEDPQKRFLLFWRCLEEYLNSALPEACWSQLPADTRIPEHSLLHHARVASAFAVIDKPVTLMFSIGPVQSFITTARKTRDLWMGSYLLSYLTWCAIKVIAEKIGPDHVLYPSLLGQPLVDLWLDKNKVPIQKPSPEKLSIATFPNKFFAIVPAEEAEKLTTEAEKALQGEWERLANKVYEYLQNEASEFDQVRNIWDRQVKLFPEVYWAIYKWHDNPKDIAKDYKRLTDSDRFEKVLKVKGKYPHNQGTLYAACYSLTERALGARKATRNFTEWCEPNGKCTLCGEKEALHDSSDWTGKAFWKKIAEKFCGDIGSDGTERLCAICTIKRFLPKVLRQELGLSEGFPSTDSIAAAPFVLTILEQKDKAVESVREFCEAIKSSPLSEVAFVGMDIPKLKKIAQSDPFTQLLKLDGEWLYEESYEPERIERAHGIKLSKDEANQLRECFRKLREAVDAFPSDYYAILMMDGDAMGKWLSGTHEDLPTFAKLLHPEVLRQMEQETKQDEEWQRLLKSNRLVSPSLHAAISQALANFALNCAPYIIEEHYAGKLVYAGGDDVLALLPLTDALSAARELRALFSGEAKREQDGNITVEFGSKQWTGWLEWDGKLLLTMGNRATASIGIVIAHRLHPLRDALWQVREAEEDAKECYGRNAICVRWLKRSGEPVQMGAQFYYPDYCLDTLALLDKVKRLLEGKDGIRLSRNFPIALLEEAFTLSTLPLEAQKAELKRLLLRHSEGEEKADELNLLSNQFLQLAQELDKHADKNADPYDLTRPQRGLVELAKWLTLMRFLAGGGK